MRTRRDRETTRKAGAVIREPVTLRLVYQWRRTKGEAGTYTATVVTGVVDEVEWEPHAVRLRFIPHHQEDKSEAEPRRAREGGNIRAARTALQKVCPAQGRHCRLGGRSWKK